VNASNFRKDLARLLNCNCAENASDTPDLLLAEYLSDCLDAFDRVTKAREKWYGQKSERVMDHEAPATAVKAEVDPFSAPPTP